MSNPIITVFGGTGAQGGGVVDALLAGGKFGVRVPTRDLNSENAKTLAARGVELIAADLNNPSSLAAAFEGASGAFLVTNFWDPDTGTSEYVQGKAAVEAAKKAGVAHLVWSTLPNVEELTGGKLGVEHFTNKAKVDALVSEAGFEHHTFVEPPFYFQNLTGMLGPQPLPDGSKGWAVPMDVNARGIYAADVTEIGKLVARVFENPAKFGQGQHVGAATQKLSWQDMVDTLNSQGHKLNVIQVPAEAYDGFFPGAAEMREMFEWFEQHTYFGPEADKKTALAREALPEGFTSFADWAEQNMAA